MKTKLLNSPSDRMKQSYSESNKVTFSKKPFFPKLMCYSALIALTLKVSPILASEVSRQSTTSSFSDSLTKDKERDAKTFAKRLKKGAYAISGIGTALPIGTSVQILSPKVSTSLGLNIGLGQSSFFLYPSADLLVFNYNQEIEEPEFPFNTRDFRGTFTTFSLMLGQKNSIGSFSIYPFAGPGLSLIKEPRARVVDGNTVAMASRKMYSTTFKGGLGLDFRIGTFTLFVEGSYIYNFKSVQERNVEVIPVFGGLKSDISTIFRRKQ